MSQVKVKGSVLPPRRNSATAESIDRKRQRRKPEFSTLGKPLDSKNKCTVKCDYPSPHFRTDCLFRAADSVTVPKCNRVDRIARELTYESILNDQLVSLETFLIRIQAADTAHDAFEILTSVAARSQETVDENIRRCENHLAAYQGESITHRVSAYAQISADITKQIESVLFTEKEGELKQYKKQQEKREEEIKRKEGNLTAQIATKIQENESFRDTNIGLSNQINLLEKKRECLMSDIGRAHRENRETQELLVEMRMQGLDFKSEVDKRCQKVIGTIREQMGYVPEAVERQLLQLINFLVQHSEYNSSPPGDPKYDTARILGDPRSIRKLRLIDDQEVNKPEGEKWLHAVMCEEEKGEIDTTGQRNVLLNNNTVEEIKKKKLRRKALSTPLSVSAVVDMNREANSILHLLRNNGLARILNNGKSFQENLLDFHKIKKISEVEENKKRKKVVLKKKKVIPDVKMSEKVEVKKKIAGPIIIPTVKEMEDTKKENTEKRIILTKKNKKKTESPRQNSVKKTVNKSAKSGGEAESVNEMDTSYENFRYSVNMLRESIVQGTAATKSNTSTTLNTSSSGDVRMLDISNDIGVHVNTKTSSSNDSNSSVNSNREIQDNIMESNRSRSTLEKEKEREKEREMRLASIARYSDSLHNSMIDTYENYADTRTVRSSVLVRSSGLTSGVKGTDKGTDRPQRTEEDWLNWARRGVRSPLSDTDFEESTVGQNDKNNSNSSSVGAGVGDDGVRGGEGEGRREEYSRGVVEIPHSARDDNNIDIHKGTLKPWGTGGQVVVQEHTSSSSDSNNGNNFSDSDSDDDGSENEGDSRGRGRGRGRGVLKVYDLPDDSIQESRFRVHPSDHRSVPSNAHEDEESGEYKGEQFIPTEYSHAVECVDDSDDGELYISVDYQQPMNSHDRGEEEERIGRVVSGTTYPDQYSISSVGDGKRMTTITDKMRSNIFSDGSAANSLQQGSNNSNNSCEDSEGDSDDDCDDYNDEDNKIGGDVSDDDKNDDKDGGERERYTSFPSDDTELSDLMGYRGPSSDLLDTYMKEIYGQHSN